MVPSRRLILVSVVAASALLTLGACAPSTHAPTHPSLHHVSGPGSSHTTSPATTALADPTVRVTTTCDQLAPAAALTSSLGTSTPLDTSPSLWDAGHGVTQDGALFCHWSNNLAGDAAETSTSFTAWVLPDVSTANWNQALTTLTQLGEAPTTVIGGTAYATCDLSPDPTTTSLCSVDTLVGTTWLSFGVESTTKAFSSGALALAHYAALINPIVTAAKASGFITEPLWKNPAATATPATCDAALPDSEIQSVTGATGVGPIGPDLSDQESVAMYSGVLANLGWVECDLASGDQSNGFFASILPGGGWAWSLEKAADAGKPGYATVPSLGTQALTFTESDSSGTEIVWVRGHNLVTLTVQLSAPAKEPADALALATYLNGRIPA